MLASLLLILTTLITDTARTNVYLSGQYGEATMTLRGTSQGGFGVHAQSIYDFNQSHRVYGEAAYTWNLSRGNQFVENADYRLLYPYLTTDTVGGGMKTETYFFRGGYRLLKSHILWHINLQFCAEQSYREIDPRPKNKVTDLNLETGLGYSDNRYAYILSGAFGRYKQTNEMKFYSELGDCMIYHMVGPGTSYARFAGSKRESYYSGYHASVSFALLPNHSGWMAAASYRWTRIGKELHDNTYVPIARLTTRDISGEVGYVSPLWRVSVLGAYTMRRGEQYVYGDAANNYYELLTTRLNYKENAWSVGLSGSYRLNLPVGYMVFLASTDYTHRYTAALPVETRWQLLNDLLTDNTIAVRTAVQYVFPIRGRYCWFVQSLADYDHYTNATRHTWQVAFRTGLTF